MKKLITLLLLVVLCVGLLVYNFTLPVQDNAQTEPVTEPEPTEPPTGEVRILNNDPSRQAAWEKLAAAYTAQIGIPVQVLTDDDQATPTLFTVSSQAELAEIQDQCLDLSGTDAYVQLASWELVLESEGKVCGIAAEVEAFGMIYNSALLGRIATPGEINGLATLKAVAETISADPGLGFASFACPDLYGSFSSRLVSMNVDFRGFWDVYSANAACAPETMGQTKPEDSLTEFLEGKAVFYLGSTADYDAISALGDHNLGIMPVYLGGEDEQRCGLCVTCDSYWCVRSDVDALDIQATLDFLHYLVYPCEDGTVPVDELELLAPYRQATYAANPLERTLRTDLAAGREYLVCEDEKEVPAGLPDALTAYATEPTDENWALVLSILNK